MSARLSQCMRWRTAPRLRPIPKTTMSVCGQCAGKGVAHGRASRWLFLRWRVLVRIFSVGRGRVRGRGNSRPNTLGALCWLPACTPSWRDLDGIASFVVQQVQAAGGAHVSHIFSEGSRRYGLSRASWCCACACSGEGWTGLIISETLQRVHSRLCLGQSVRAQ
jgi:hypothetical protein